MKKNSLMIIIGILAVSLPAFAGRNMDSDRLTASIKNCSYYKTSFFVNKNGTQIQYKEKVQGYVDGKCRYVTEFHYPDGTATGRICNLDEYQLNTLYNAKMKHEKFDYSQCDMYTLKNDQWVKDNK